MFEHIADAFGILITLDQIFAEGGTLREHWNQYKRYAPIHVNTMRNIQCIVLYLHDIVYPEILVTTCWTSNPFVHIEVIL